MKGGMKKAFTALLAATVLVGGMPVNMQANVIAETEKAESASEKVNEKYADTEELDLMDRAGSTVCPCSQNPVPWYLPWNADGDRRICPSCTGI